MNHRSEDWPCRIPVCMTGGSMAWPGPTRTFSEPSSALEPGEVVQWTGRPSPRAILMRSLSEGLLGLVVVFALFWGLNVARGGRNNWDRGKIVPALRRSQRHDRRRRDDLVQHRRAPHDNLPLRAHRKARGTTYMLTDRRQFHFKGRPQCGREGLVLPTQQARHDQAFGAVRRLG